MAPGRYDELIDVFSNVDAHAVDIILNTAAKFAEIEREIQELKSSKKRYALLRSIVKQSEITPAHLENLYYILHHVLQHSKASHSWKNDLQQVANDVTMQVSNNKPGKAQKWRSIINREELKKSIIERGKLLSKTHEMSLDVLVHINLFIATFTKTTQYSLETIKPDGLYVQGHEQKSQNPEVAGRAVCNFLLTVFTLLGYDMRKSTISTELVFINEEMFENALKRRWPIPPKLNITTSNDKVPAVKTIEPVHYNVVLSYQWDSRDVVQRVKQYLEKNKVTCWVDTDHVTGDKRPAVENAIEEADLCLMFYSFKYFISKNCRQEAEYAGKLGKIIIPIKVNRDYDPKGWLGNIVGAKRIFEFSGKYPFERQVPELLTQIRICLKNLPPKPPKDDDTTKDSSGHRRPQVDGENSGAEYLHLIGRIQTKVKPGIGQLTCKDDQIWVGNGDNLLVCIDQEGNEMETVCLGQGQLKTHALAEGGEVFLINRNSLMKRVRRQLRPFISYFANGDAPMCVARSSENGDLIVGLYNQEEQRAKVARYSDTGKEMFVVENDLEGRSILEWPLQIAVKKNDQICICDSKKGIVVLEGSGIHLFTYPIDNPCGLCVDNEYCVLVCNGSNRIHAISPEGQLLRTYRVNKHRVTAINVLLNSRLLVGFKKSGIVEVYRYEQHGTNDT